LVYTDLNGLKCSRIMLGTVQMGLDYGIANKTGKVSYTDARDIIAFALNSGINAFDTAPAYGGSEKILGKIFTELKAVTNKDFFISDKIPPVPEGLSLKKIREYIETSVYNSLKKLRLNFISLCLFHREKDACYLEELLRLKEKGIIGLSGISVYSPDTTLNILKTGKSDTFQLPASILDLRFLRAGIYVKAKRKKTAVFARSIYLQGLLIMNEKDIPPAITSVIPVIRSLRNLAQDTGITLRELALRYVLAIQGINSLVIGAETTAQINENIKFINKGPLDSEICSKIETMVPCLPDEVILPSKWKK
jgi:aryl-alcohol dehydrogenase-like predicted oxidoreductase